MLNKPYDKITHLSLFCLISLLIDHYLIYSYSFIIYLIYSIFNEYSTLLLSRFKKIKKKFISSILIFIVMLPFTVNFNNSINIFSLILQFFLIPIMKILFILGLILIGISIKLYRSYVGFSEDAGINIGFESLWNKKVFV